MELFPQNYGTFIKNLKKNIIRIKSQLFRTKMVQLDVGGDIFIFNRILAIIEMYS